MLSVTTDDLIDRVDRFSREFARRKVESGVYAQRNQTDEEKIYLDCRDSKLAEWAVYYWLSQWERLTPLEPPLMRLLRSPNWDADLKTTEYKIAVKNCPRWSAERYGLSWTFQQGRGHDPILDIRDENYKVVFVETLEDFQFRIYGTSDTRRLKDANAYLFEGGIDKPALKGIKLFVKADKTSAIKVVNTVVDLSS